MADLAAPLRGATGCRHRAERGSIHQAKETAAIEITFLDP
jgi:hypothetical protein